MSGISLDIRHDMNGLSVRYGLMRRDRVAATVRALNRTISTVRKDSARRLQVEYVGLKIAAIKRRVRLLRATQRNPVAALVFSGKRIPLYGNFGMRGVARWGVQFRGLPWRIETVTGEQVTPDMLQRAFRQRSSRTGRADVFARHTAARASFELLLAPGLARAVVERKIGDALVRLARERFSVVFEQEAQFRLSKGKL